MSLPLEDNEEGAALWSSSLGLCKKRVDKFFWTGAVKR